MTTTRLIGVLVAGAAVLAPLATAAQDVRNVPVQNRARPDYDPLGIRARAFLIYPEIATGVAYDDNIFSTNDDEDDDVIFTVRPEITALSQWSRHQLNVSAFGDFGFYGSHQDSNYQDFGVGLGGRLDALRNSRTSIQTAFARLHEDSEEADAQGNEDVTQYYRTSVNLNHRHEFTRIYVQPIARFLRLDYDNAGDIDNSDRDRNEYSLGLRTGYALSPRITPFVELIGSAREYDETPGLDRNSTGFDALIGTTIDFTGVIFGEVSAGYTRREYDDNDLENVDGFAGNAGVTWNVTPLTSVIFDGQAGIDETTVVYQGDTATANNYAGLGINVFHELRRNIILNVNGEYVRDDYEGTGRTDNTYTAGAGVSYLINRRFSLDATYDFSHRQSDDGNAEFDRNIFRLGLVAKL